MSNNANERHVGHKVQLWVPDALYAALKARAVRHDTSLAEELRKAASAGLDPLNGLDTIQDMLIDLRQFEKLHLEPLAYIAAIDFAPFFCTLAISFELMLILASFFSPVGWD